MPTSRKGTTEDVRRDNLAAILAQLHLNGPASRSILAQLTGRNRSTIASLVGDLVELGLVTESAPPAEGRQGRPSPVVAIRPEVVALVCNPEIDALTIGVVGLDGTVRSIIRHDYGRPPTAAEVWRLAADVVADLRSELADLRVVGMGSAVPGQVRTEDGVIRNAPHLGWREEPFARPLQQACGYPVWVGNDAAVGALAETQFGAGRGATNVVYLNGGASGIGGGVIVDGRLLRGASGYAGELGHLRVSGSEQADSAGIPGTVEAVVTRSELLAAFQVDRATGDELARLLRGPLPAAVVDVVTRQVAHLGVAVAGAINVFNPEFVVLGGFLADLQACAPADLDARVGQFALAPLREHVQIVPSALGETLLVVGAAGLAFAPLLRDPARIQLG
ncbi:MAG TPA: ROK family transcriptional regulator [Propionicimonas sp.]|nr:ROK family transcriptional regulator [Propionicimonas sp.]